jgi:hypothetical protein
MNDQIDKSKIIEAIKETDDERILFAINRLLQIDEENIPEWHKEIVEQRWKEMQGGKAEFTRWEDIKDTIFKNK